MKLGPEDFASVFKEPLSDYVAGRVEAYGFEYGRLTPAGRDECILTVLHTLGSDLVQAGEKRRWQWEAGWDKHLAALDGDFDPRSIRPGYFGKYGILRWKQDFIRPISQDFEYNSLSIIQDWLFDKYIRNAGNVYEFGCGTGHNLFRVRDVNPFASLWGLDWAESSQKLLWKMIHKGVISGTMARPFDIFAPDRDFHLEPNSVVFTCAALEQVGEGFMPFVDYLLREKPALCIHIEPIEELLSSGNLLDYLSLQYFKKRNYLSGFLTWLRQLESMGGLKVHRAQRTYIGSLFIDGYSVIVWSPLVEEVA